MNIDGFAKLIGYAVVGLWVLGIILVIIMILFAKVSLTEGVAVRPGCHDAKGRPCRYQRREKLRVQPGCHDAWGRPCVRGRERFTNTMDYRVLPRSRQFVEQPYNRAYRNTTFV